MIKPRIFISFDFDRNYTDKVLFAGQAKNSRVTFDLEDWSSKRHLPQDQWERLINEKISRTHILLVLVGKSTYLAKGVEKEIKFAKNNNVPVFGVYVGGANMNTPLPNGLARDRVINWDWDKIANAISKLMNDGKNRY